LHYNHILLLFLLKEGCKVYNIHDILYIMYNTIVNPTTRRKVRSNSVLGRKIIKKYIQQIGTGGGDVGDGVGGANWQSHGAHTNVTCFYCSNTANPVIGFCTVIERGHEILTNQPICRTCKNVNKCNGTVIALDSNPAWG